MSIASTCFGNLFQPPSEVDVLSQQHTDENARINSGGGVYEAGEYTELVTLQKPITIPSRVLVTIQYRSSPLVGCVDRLYNQTIDLYIVEQLVHSFRLQSTIEGRLRPFVRLRGKGSTATLILDG